MTTGTTKSNPRVIGIDLGTTNTVAAYADGRIPRVIPTEKGHNLLASVVAFVGDRVLIGQPAKDQLLINPVETIYGSKRILGRPFHSPQAERLRSKFAYRIVEGERGLCAVDAGGRTRPLTEISAILLRQIKSYAEQQLGGAIDGAVISVPAYYPESQRDAVRRAGREAGLDVWRLVNEPTAAAIAYGTGRSVDERVLVFDLGGGTFDVSILDISGGTFEVLATGGDGFLGGVDFDIALTEHLLQRFHDEEGVDLTDDVNVVQRVLSAAEAAKIDLSLLQHTEVRLPYVAEKRGRPLDLWLHVDRVQLQKLTEPLVDRAIAIVERALKDASMKPSDIDQVLLAGGQTRMPFIQNRLERAFGKPPKRGVHPDEVVAQGAALLARSLAHGDGMRLLDVLSVPIGIRDNTHGAPSSTLTTVLPRGTSLPGEETFRITTTRDHQTTVEIDVFQSEAPDVADAEYLGTILYDGIPADKAGARTLHLVFHLDVDALLTVSAHLGNPQAATPLHLVRRAIKSTSTDTVVGRDKSTSGEGEPVSLLRRFFSRR